MNWFENLRALKAKSNMSMREIALKSEIPEPTLEKIFSGATKNPGVNTIQTLVHALGYTLNDIDPGARKSPSGSGVAQAEPPQARSSPESAIAEQIKSAYGESVSDTFSMYVLLDAGDQGEIRGEIKQMLKQGKYLKQEGNLA